MTQTDIIKAAHAAKPDLMQKTATMLQELESLDPVSAQEVAAEMREITAYALGKSKEASVGGFFADVGKGIAGTVVLGLGTAIATDLYNASRRGLTSGRNWKRMIEANPALKDHPQERVRSAFHMLQRHAPDVASDPMAAGAMVYNVVHSGEMEGSAHKLMESMVKAQTEKAKSYYAPFSGGAKVTVQGSKDERPKTGGSSRS